MKQFQVGMVANLRHVKGPDVFIRAARLIVEQFPTAQFEIAGDGDLVRYQDLIDTLECGANVRLLGAVSDVPAFLARLDVAVSASRAEGSSNALLEYLAAGRPIVATDVGGSSELLGDLAQQCLVASENTEAIATRISCLLNDPLTAEQMAKKARARSLTEFNICRLEAVYTNVVSCRCPNQSQ